MTRFFFILNKASWFNHLQNVLPAVSFENRLLFQLFVAPVLTCLRYVAEIKFNMNQYFTRKVTMYQFKHLVCFLCFTMQIILFTRCANQWILFWFPFFHRIPTLLELGLYFNWQLMLFKKHFILQILKMLFKGHYVVK